MIDEEATKEVFGYSVSKMRPERGELIIASCELCGKFKVVARYGYRTFCFSCLEKLTPNWNKGRCPQCRKLFRCIMSEIQKGKGEYCCQRCYNTAHSSPKKVAVSGKNNANSRGLCYVLLLPLGKGEVGHHVTSEHVIGVPAEVHEKLSGGGREKHRAKVLKWLKANDKKKYEIVLSIFEEKL